MGYINLECAFPCRRRQRNSQNRLCWTTPLPDQFFQGPPTEKFLAAPLVGAVPRKTLRAQKFATRAQLFTLRAKIFTPRTRWGHDFTVVRLQVAQCCVVACLVTKQTPCFSNLCSICLFSQVLEKIKNEQWLTVLRVAIHSHTSSSLFRIDKAFEGKMVWSRGLKGLAFSLANTPPSLASLLFPMLQVSPGVV